jgi:gliding motility-associated protein GldC
MWLKNSCLYVLIYCPNGNSIKVKKINKLLKVKKSDIIITVGLDEDNVPAQMHWSAPDAIGGAQNQECKAMLLSLFNGDTRETMKIDLWTKAMQIDEMDRFVYQTLRSLCDTYHRATNNIELANTMANFTQYFGEQVEVIPRQKA